jgi:hypothetical protein
VASAVSCFSVVFAAAAILVERRAIAYDLPLIGCYLLLSALGDVIKCHGYYSRGHEELLYYSCISIFYKLAAVSAE